MTDSAFAMKYDVWNDGGEFNTLLQKHIKAAVASYVGEGHLFVDEQTLSVRYDAADPLDDMGKAETLEALIESTLENWISGPLSDIDLLAYDFTAQPPETDVPTANLIKLQQCLRVLRS